MRFGRVKVLAHRAMKGEPIPLFVDNRVNRAIEEHVERIRKAKTRRTK